MSDAAALGRTALFSGLDEAVLQRLAAMATPLTFAAGATIFQKGDPSRSLYVVERGRVKISTLSADGREMVLNLLGAGASFGEVALVDGGPRTADATAFEPVRLLALERGPLIALLEADPAMMLRMLAGMAQLVRWASDNYEDTAFLGVPARLAKRLLFLGQHFGVDTQKGRRLTVSLPQRELAAHMGVTRETINRLLQEWQADGLILIDRGFIVLADAPRLVGLAGG